MNPNSGLPLALTAGEPAGIGPDLCIALARTELAAQVVVIADPAMLAARARDLGVALEIVEAEAPPGRPGALAVVPQPLARPAVTGPLDPDKAETALADIQATIAA